MINHMKLRQIRELIGIHEGIIDAENEKKDIRKSEIGLLKDFLYEAVFVPERVEAPPRDIVERPELRVYTDAFGTREGDNCLVAELGGRVVGSVWTRIMDDYGHVDDETPSCAVSLYKEYRGQGIGSQLMMKMRKNTL